MKVIAALLLVAAMVPLGSRGASDWVEVFSVHAIWGKDRPEVRRNTGYSHWFVSSPAGVHVFQDRSIHRTYLIHAMVRPGYSYEKARLVFLDDQGDRLAVVHPRVDSKLLSFESPDSVEVEDIATYSLQMLR